MTELKHTVTEERVYGYEAFDGTFFTHKDQCESYENSAFGAASKAAKAFEFSRHRMENVNVCDAGCDEEIVVYDIYNADALQIVNTYLRFLDGCKNDSIDPKYIGRKVAVQMWYDNEGSTILGDYEELKKRALGNLRNLFWGAEEEEA